MPCNFNEHFDFIVQPVGILDQYKAFDSLRLAIGQISKSFDHGYLFASIRINHRV